jgi:hypothetical protein
MAAAVEIGVRHGRSSGQPLSPATGYLLGRSTRKECTDPNGVDAPRAYIDQDGRETLRALGQESADCARGCRQIGLGLAFQILLLRRVSNYSDFKFSNSYPPVPYIPAIVAEVTF